MSPARVTDGFLLGSFSGVWSTYAATTSTDGSSGKSSGARRSQGEGTSCKSLSRKAGLTVVGWVQPTDVRPWHLVGCTHPTDRPPTLPGQTLPRLPPVCNGTPHEIHDDDDHDRLPPNRRRSGRGADCASNHLGAECASNHLRTKVQARGRPEAPRKVRGRLERHQDVLPPGRSARPGGGPMPSGHDSRGP